MPLRIAVLGWLALQGGCANPDEAIGFSEPDPAARFRAAHRAVQGNDSNAIPSLIGMLDSDDPAERLVAIRSLERMTNQTLGYEHSAPRAERDAAVGRWVSWYRERQGLSSDSSLTASVSDLRFNGTAPSVSNAR